MSQKQILPLQIFFDKDKTDEATDETFLDVWEFHEWTPEKGCRAEYFIYNPNEKHVFLLHQMNGQSIFSFTARIPDEAGRLHDVELGSVSHPEAVLPQETVKLVLEIKPIPLFSELSEAEIAWYVNHEIIVRFEIKDGKLPIFPIERYQIWKLTKGRNPNVTT